MWSVERVCEVLKIVGCRGVSAEWKLQGVKCKLRSVKCGVWSAEFEV